MFRVAEIKYIMVIRILKIKGKREYSCKVFIVLTVLYLSYYIETIRSQNKTKMLKLKNIIAFFMVC